MTGLRNGFAGPEPLRDDEPPIALPPGRRSRQDLANGTGMAELHESIASLLASRGQWRQAYHHLRSALDLKSTADPPRVPEQLRHEVNRLRREHAEAREQSLRDSLTASYNRRYLDERLADLLADHVGTDHGLAVALVDLDWFKQVNDTYGHLLGDRVLQRVVDLLQEVLPTGAFCARYGGEEFVLVLPNIEPAAAVAVCETARSRVERFPWAQMAPGLRVTVSAGVAHEHTTADSAPVSAEQQLLSADALLYAAKQSGRNAVAYRTGAEVRLAGIAAGRRGAAARRVAGY
ncbi:GGDEF domain-containing protein [Saccharopolyspora sp. NPDC050642]|uniref:GGDEF domain-containing protein n=1 Tax=Saccharopolyspora sp. NPDC050642 TaxID=3157099 RepID=UPI0033E92D3B